MLHPVTDDAPAARLAAPNDSAALPREARLTKPAEFRHVFQKPATSADRFFKVLARANASGRPRLGMAVSRQVDKRAAGRNRVKRVIRESFRSYFRDTRAPLDFVVLPRREAASTDNERLSESLSVHWDRLTRRVSVGTEPA